TDFLLGNVFNAQLFLGLLVRSFEVATLVEVLMRATCCSPLCLICSYSSVVSRYRQSFVLSLRVALAGPCLCCDREIERAGWLARHEMGELLGVAEAFRYFGNDLIVYVQHDGISGGLDPQHRLSK